MAVDNSNTCPSELKSFLSGAGEAFMRPLIALGVAESLTDEVATQLAVLSGLSKREANGLVKSLHFCDFVVERNSEWHFSSQVIECLNAEMACQDELVHKAHSLLLEIAMTGDIKCAGNTIPRYLLSDIGRAYHKSPLSPEEGLKIYASAADKKISGSQWLLGKLAIAQQNKGILPPEAIEPSYIRGMTYYREGQQKEAEYFLGRVVESTEIRVEVAIACHIVGRLLARKRGKRDEAEKLLRRSLLIGEDINHKHHQAQVLHTLGQLIGENRNRSDEAEKLLRRSLDLLKKLKDKHGQAQALHTLGQLIGKN
ncbi:Tetratricopeptide repeat-containing protein, partial [Geoalkalibacter ferrihydriticus]